MRFPELKKYATEYPQLTENLRLLDTYLAGIADAGSERDIVPIIVAQNLSITEARALALLGLCEDSGILVSRYNLRCSESRHFIATCNLDNIPPIVFCPVHGSDHNADEYELQLVFRFAPRAKRLTTVDSSNGEMIQHARSWIKASASHAS